jgi:hypothetical protein
MGVFQQKNSLIMQEAVKIQNGDLNQNLGE